MTEKLCPCGSKKTYESCCKPYHGGTRTKDVLDLMRSRYSAYVFNHPDYIIRTTHPASPHYLENKFAWKREIAKFSESSTFHKLDILDFKTSGSMASVTFTAHITQHNQDATFTEKSFFEKLGNRWLYRSGLLAQGHAPNLITTGQLKMLPLAYYGDPILRRKADPIEEITDDIRILVNEMIETMDACKGVGLAAPQVHLSIRLFITRAPMEVRASKFAPGELKVYINPQISSHSNETWTEQEGCLSIPTIHSFVERPKEIDVTYTDLQGHHKKKRYSGWEAKIIMHENDHLDGVLFIDHLPKREQKKLKPFLDNLKKRIHDGTEL